MLDWYSGLIGYDGSELRPNTVAETTHKGDLVWQISRKIQVEGSYSSSVQIAPATPTEGMLDASELHGLACSPSCLYVSGNPSKFLQGHNVIGPAVGDLGPVLRDMVRAFPAGIRPRNADDLLLPAIHRTRVDVTITVDLGSHALVHEWLRSAAESTKSRHGRAMVSGTTVYWGKTSRRWSMKAYCKFCELSKHRPTIEGWEGTLLPWSEGKLRLELTLRAPMLKELGTLDESLVWDYFDRIQESIMPHEMANTLDRCGVDLARGVRLTLMEWQAGVDVRFTLPRRTFYDHRRRILQELGLDISLPFYRDEVEREVFDLDYLKAHQCPEVPEGLQGYMFEVEKGPVWPARVQC